MSIVVVTYLHRDGITCLLTVGSVVTTVNIHCTRLWEDYRGIIGVPMSVNALCQGNLKSRLSFISISLFSLFFLFSLCLSFSKPSFNPPFIFPNLVLSYIKNKIDTACLKAYLVKICIEMASLAYWLVIANLWILHGVYKTHVLGKPNGR